MKILMIILTLIILTSCNKGSKESVKINNDKIEGNVDNVSFQPIGFGKSIDTVNFRMMEDTSLNNIIFFNDFIERKYFEKLNLHEIERYIIEPIMNLTQVQEFDKTFYYRTIDDQKRIIGLSYRFLLFDDIRFVISIALDQRYYFPLEITHTDTIRKKEITAIANQKIYSISKFNFYQSIHAEKTLLDNEKKKKLIELLSRLKFK